MHYIVVYFCQQSEFGDSADSSNMYLCHNKYLFHCFETILSIMVFKVDRGKKLVRLACIHLGVFTFLKRCISSILKGPVTFRCLKYIKISTCIEGPMLSSNWLGVSECRWQVPVCLFYLLEFLLSSSKKSNSN